MPKWQNFAKSVHTDPRRAQLFDQNVLHRMEVNRVLYDPQHQHQQQGFQQLKRLQYLPNFANLPNFTNVPNFTNLPNFTNVPNFTK